MNNNDFGMEQDIGINFWLGWVFGSGAAWFLTVFLIPTIGLELGALLVGGFVGGVQWLMLRRWVPNAGWWIIITIIGVGLIGTLGGVDLSMEALVRRDGRLDFVSLTVGNGQALIAGVFVHIVLQWLILRTWVRQAYWWILMAGFSWLVGLVIIYQLTQNIVDNILVGGLNADEVIVFGMTVSTALSGMGLIWLLRQPRPEVRIPITDSWGQFFRSRRKN